MVSESLAEINWTFLSKYDQDQAPCCSSKKKKTILFHLSYVFPVETFFYHFICLKCLQTRALFYYLFNVDALIQQKDKRRGVCDLVGAFAPSIRLDKYSNQEMLISLQTGSLLSRWGDRQRGIKIKLMIAYSGFARTYISFFSDKDTFIRFQLHVYQCSVTICTVYLEQWIREGIKAHKSLAANLLVAYI